ADLPRGRGPRQSSGRITGGGNLGRRGGELSQRSGAAPGKQGSGKGAEEYSPGAEKQEQEPQFVDGVLDVGSTRGDDHPPSRRRPASVGDRGGEDPQRFAAELGVGETAAPGKRRRHLGPARQELCPQSQWAGEDR